MQSVQRIKHRRQLLGAQRTGDVERVGAVADEVDRQRGGRLNAHTLRQVGGNVGINFIEGHPTAIFFCQRFDHGILIGAGGIDVVAAYIYHHVTVGMAHFLLDVRRRQCDDRARCVFDEGFFGRFDCRLGWDRSRGCRRCGRRQHRVDHDRQLFGAEVTSEWSRARVLVFGDKDQGHVEEARDTECLREFRRVRHIDLEELDRAAVLLRQLFNYLVLKVTCFAHLVAADVDDDRSGRVVDFRLQIVHGGEVGHRGVASAFDRRGKNGANRCDGGGWGGRGAGGDASAGLATGNDDISDDNDKCQHDNRRDGYEQTIRLFHCATISQAYACWRPANEFVW